MKNTHQCESIKTQNSFDDTQVEIKVEKDTCTFERNRYSCELCVEDGEAQYVDELMFGFKVDINSCPYCGERFVNNTINANPIITKEDPEFDYRHTCNPLEKYNVFFTDLNIDGYEKGLWVISRFTDESWMFERYFFSIESMVEDEEADFVGELCFEFGTGISFCPFCGIKLNKLQNEPIAADAYGLS